MLTPVEMQGTVLKSGRGYHKKETDAFLDTVFSDYESLYKENIELKDKLNTLSDGLQYYKDLEKTLQKTLVIAEQTADDTKSAAQKQGEMIELKAKTKADAIISSANKQAAFILSDAKEQAKTLNVQMEGLQQQQEIYKIKCHQLASAQIELMDSFIFAAEPVKPIPIPKDFQDKRECIAEETEEEPAIKADHTAETEQNSKVKHADSPIDEELAEFYKN